MAADIERLQELGGTGLADVHSGAGDKIRELVAGHNNMRSGVATVLTGEDDVTVPEADIGFAYGGKPAFAMLGFIDGTALVVGSCVWSDDDLVITVNANATADTLVYWFVDGRE